MTIREMMAMYHSLQFVEELLDYIEQYPDDDYMTMECLCRKLVKYHLMSKVDGYYIADRKTEPQTCEECEHWNDTEDGCADRHGCKTEQTEREVEPMKTTDYCDICKGDMCEVCIADATNPYCVPSHYEINYEPKDEPQTEDGWCNPVIARKYYPPADAGCKTEQTEREGE